MPKAPRWFPQWRFMWVRALVYTAWFIVAGVFIGAFAGLTGIDIRLVALAVVGLSIVAHGLILRP